MGSQSLIGFERASVDCKLHYTPDKVMGGHLSFSVKDRVYGSHPSYCKSVRLHIESPMKKNQMRLKWVPENVYLKKINARLYCSNYYWKILYMHNCDCSIYIFDSYSLILQHQFNLVTLQLKYLKVFKMCKCYVHVDVIFIYQMV